jgi:hypothetical protein
MAFADVEQPQTFAQRCALGKRIRDELEVPLPILVDGMDDQSRALFSDLPSPAFVLDTKGTIVDKLPWADPEPLAASIARALTQRAPAAPAPKPAAPQAEPKDRCVGPAPRGHDRPANSGTPSPNDFAVTNTVSPARG